MTLLSDVQPGSVNEDQAQRDLELLKKIWEHPECGRRIGAQVPRIESYPEGLEYSAEDALDLMAAAGKPLDEWQEYVVRRGLRERQDGRWSAFEVATICTRQNGKNVIIEARELAGLFLFDEKVIIHSAHQLKTARKSFRDMEKLIRGTPGLLMKVRGYRPIVHGVDPQAQITGIKDQTNEILIELAEEYGGGRLEYHARSTGGARGFTGDLIVLDEAFDLDPEELAAMLPTMAARSMEGNPQIWYASSAGLPKSKSLSDLRDRGISGESPRLAYFEWSAPDDVESDDVDAIYLANPGLGIRISLEWILENEYESMSDEQYRRERLGIWAQLGGETAISDSEWSRLLDPDSLPGVFVAFAVDIPRTGDSANVAVVSGRADGRLHAEVIARRNGTSWVPLFLRELQQAWGAQGTQVFLDFDGAASALEHDLSLERVRYSYLNRKQIARACSVFFNDVLERRIVHRGQEEVDEARKVAATRAVGDGLWKFVGTTKTADLSPLYALVLARAGWSLRGEKKERNRRRREAGVGVNGRGASRRVASRRTAGRR